MESAPATGVPAGSESRKAISVGVATSGCHLHIVTIRSMLQASWCGKRQVAAPTGRRHVLSAPMTVPSRRRPLPAWPQSPRRHLKNNRRNEFRRLNLNNLQMKSLGCLLSPAHPGKQAKEAAQTAQGHGRWFGDGLDGQVSKIAEACYSSLQPLVAIKSNRSSNSAAGSESDRLAEMCTAAVNPSKVEDICRNPVNIKLADSAGSDTGVNVGTCGQHATDGTVLTNGTLGWPHADAGPIKRGA